MMNVPAATPLKIQLQLGFNPAGHFLILLEREDGVALDAIVDKDLARLLAEALLRYANGEMINPFTDGLHIADGT